MPGVGSGLVGRDAVLAAAAGPLDEALAGAGQLLLLTGEPGIGKTALLGELARAARRRGARVLWATCWADGGAPVYWPWTQVLRGAGDVGLGEAARLVGGPAAAPTGAEEAADARFRLFDAVAQAVVRLTEDAPLVVVFDDLQWADGPSLRLLEFVVGQLGMRPVAVLGGYRDAEAGPELRALAGRGQVLPLGGLGVDDVAGLMIAAAGPGVPAPPERQVAEHVWRRTGGNPFYVRELTRLLVADGGWASGSVRHAPVPDTVRDTLERRLARLSQPCVALLEVAALTGPEVRPWLVDAVLPTPGGPGDLLDEARRARVLIPGPEGGHRFAHDLFRETLVAALPAARRGELHLRIGRALAQRHGAGAAVGAGEPAAQFVAAGTAAAAPDALRFSLAAAREATARLGHEDACRHYEHALRALDMLETPDEAERTSVLLELAAAADRAGDGVGARERFRDAAASARRAGDPAGLARAAIGTHGLGTRSGMVRSDTIDLLAEAAAALPPDAASLRVRVLAALAMQLRHGSFGEPAGPALAAAQEAVALARAADDPAGLASALLALHDALWRPGAGRERLAVLAEMLDAAERAGDRDVSALAHQLRSAALLELGDPAALGELSGFVRRATELGHARGRYLAVTRRATLALLSGRPEEAAALSAEGRELGVLIGQVDADGVFGTVQASLGFLGVPSEPPPEGALDADPVGPMLPVLRAWGLVGAGRLAEARRELAGFATDLVADKHDLEFLALLAAATTEVGSTEQRAQAYRRLLPHAGLHVVVGGCASYSGAVDHHLGLLAAALGRPVEAAEHLAAAVEAHERLGVPAWAEWSRAALARLCPVGNRFRRDGDVWTLGFAEVAVHLPDVKGLHDLAALLAAPGTPVHVFTLLGREAPATGADPVLDEPARRAYRARLADLDAELDEARAWQDLGRAERVEAERAALVRELAAATGLGGRRRRLGDETERARKTVTARIRDGLARIERAHPPLGAHLRAAVSTGTSCVYRPAEPTSWQL